jgi:predicted Zn-dependent protease
MIGLLTHKRTVEALAVALAVHAMDPASPTALFNVATLLYTLGRPNEALALYDELQRRRQAPSSTWWKDPTNALDYSRALALLGSGRAATARPLLERIVAAEPHLSEAALALALLDAEEKRNPRRNFVLGSWRTRAAPMVCGGTGNNGSSATDPFESGEQLALPFETILDFGRGSGGVLPAVPLASSVYMPSTLLQRIEERKRREAAEMQSLREQKRTLYGRSSGV